MKKLLKSLLTLLLVFALVACNQAQNPGGEPTPNNPSEPSMMNKEKVAQGVTDTEVVVANCAATSGPYAPVGVPFVAGIEAYFKKINEEGGVNGRQIRFIHQDDEFDAAKGKACLQSMVEDEKVFAIVGHFGTPVVAATIQDLKEFGIPAVYFATGIGQLYNDKAEGADKVLFPVQPIYITEGQIMVTRAVGNFGAKKIGIIYTNDDAGKDMLAGARTKAAELGVELVEAQVEPSTTDVSAAVTQIKNAEVDFIIGASIQQTIGTIVKGLAAQNVNKDVITTYVNVAPTIAEQTFDAMAGNFNLYGNGWVSFTQESSLAELPIYQAHIAPEYALNAYAITGWIAAHFFTEGLKRVGDGTLSWANYIAAMESAPINNPFGGLIDFGNGLRAGTNVMNLSKVDSSQGWVEVEPLQSVEDILAGK